MSVPLAENYTEGTMGHLECFASIEGISLIDRVHAEHDNVVAEEGINNVYTLSPRVKGVMLTDCNDLENLAICPSYDVNGEATPTANGLYVPGAQEQSYFTELTSPGARGPRFYLPYQKHIRPVWEGNGYMRTSDIYALKESVTDAKVMWVENKRNLHFEAFRRNLVIAPGTDIPGFTG